MRCHPILCVQDEDVAHVGIVRQGILEKLMQAGAQAALDLKQSAVNLSGVLRVSDSGIFPHPRIIETILTSRCIQTLGQFGEVKLAGYGTGSGAKFSGRIDKRFKEGSK